MAVETLAIISSSLAGLANPGQSTLGSVSAWMISHGMRPAHVAIGAIAGAFLLDGGVVAGAAKGALAVGIVEALYSCMVR